jgi:KDO2-lipid IV(A) lauroyltransferase
MASAARYYAELFELPRMSREVIDARARTVDMDGARELIERDGRIITALSHSGNWDLTGAFACRHLAAGTAVAEVLEPRAAFEQFVAIREGLGMTILGSEGSSTFRRLITMTRDKGGVIALVADRDMSGSGVPVQMWGHGAKVAAGPAALAVATRTAVVPVMVHYERLSGQRRRRARSRWGIVLTFGTPIEVRADAGREQVGEITARWVEFMEAQIAAHPEDWHMLQRFGWTS